MTPQELKASILQLAIQGKLVEQRPEEGTGAELLEKILAAKNAKCAKGGSRSRATALMTGGTGETGGTGARHASPARPSSLPSVPPEDAPFDIPESWVWVRLGDVVFNHGQKKPLEDFSYIDIGSIDNKKQRLSDSETIVHAKDASPRARKIVHKGDVLYATVRPYLHNICVIDRDFTREPIASTGFAVMACADSLHNKYLFFYLLSPDFDCYANSSENAKGVAYPAISDTKLYNAWLPLPPLAEQKRIVAKIEELLPLIDRYEKAWGKLEDFNRRFPVDMQKSLLQMAIQGKLVEQRPEEGTGEELYKQIQTEKQRLIKTGIIKKEKPLPEITDDEIPFDIPESWKWVRWGDLSQSIQYGYNAPAQAKGRIKMVRISDIQDGEVLWDKVPYCEISEDDIPAYLLRENDILFARTGGTVGKSFLVKDVPEDAIYAGYLIRTRYSQSLCPGYLKCFMGSSFYWSQLRDGTIATAQPNCNGKTLSKMLLPLPPLAEQKRIVAKLEELLPLCERLK